MITGDFTSVTGNMKKPSQMYHLEWLRAQCKIHGHIAPSSKVVKNINAYLEYLKQRPRNLCAYSDCFIELAEEGYFHATEKEWNLAVQAYMINIRDNIPEKPETGPYFEPRPLPNKKPKLTTADHTFEKIRDYCRQPQPINFQGLITWAKKQEEFIKTHVCTQLYRRRDFHQLVEKAIQINKSEKVAEDWYTALSNYTPRKGTMSIGDSVQLLREWHNHNGIPLQSSEGGPSLTEMLDQILSKRIEKKLHNILRGFKCRKKHRHAQCILSISRMRYNVPRSKQQLHVRMLRRRKLPNVGRSNVCQCPTRKHKITPRRGPHECSGEKQKKRTN